MLLHTRLFTNRVQNLFRGKLKHNSFYRQKVRADSKDIFLHILLSYADVFPPHTLSQTVLYINDGGPL